MIYDFLVIGGGIAGASAAFELAAHGTVLLLEAESTTGYHATGRSAALFTRNYGNPVVRKINAASAPFFRSPPAGFCETPLLTPRGSLTVAHPDHKGGLNDVLALSEPGEEVAAISSKEACEMVIQDKLIKIGGEGGLIAVDRLGNPALIFNSEGMYRGWCNAETATVSIYK